MKFVFQICMYVDSITNVLFLFLFLVFVVG